MSTLIPKAILKLIFFDLCLRLRNFAALHESVRNHSVQTRTPPVGTLEKICEVIDLVCIWYPKQVRCLQRSAVTACVLKDQGIAANMVIGSRHMPFRAHAWVEVDGRVVNDKSDVRELYAVLDRC